MQIVSTNVGEAATITHRGKEIRTGIFKYPVRVPIRLGTWDVDGDDVVDRRYHGGADKACYLYSSEHYAYWKDLYPNLDWRWGMFGENLTVAGLDESELRIGDIFTVGTARIQIAQPRQPCYKLGIRFADVGVVKQFVDAMKPGAYVRVLKEGRVSIGDELTAEMVNPGNLTVREVFHLLYNPKENLPATRAAIGISELAESCRKDLMKNTAR